MEQLYPLIRSVSIFFLLVLFIQILKRRGFFETGNTAIFGKVITEIILPITIFSTLAVGEIKPQLIYASLIYLVASLLICCIAYIICTLFHFSNPITGTIVILAGFGSTSTIAYPLISQTYGINSEAMTSALIIGEFGSCIPFFTIGILIVAYFGQRSSGSLFYNNIIAFFRSPIFISLIAGLVVSQIPTLSTLMTSPFFTSFFEYFNNGFEMLVAITIGLMLKPIKINDILIYMAITLPLALICLPLLVYAGATLTQTPSLIREILVIEAAVPSGTVAAVMAERYGCDGSLASTIVIISFLLSLVTIPLISITLL